MLTRDSKKPKELIYILGLGEFVIK